MGDRFFTKFAEVLWPVAQVPSFCPPPRVVGILSIHGCLVNAGCAIGVGPFDHFKVLV